MKTAFCLLVACLAGMCVLAACSDRKSAAADPSPFVNVEILESGRLDLGSIKVFRDRQTGRRILWYQSHTGSDGAMVVLPE